MADRTPLVIASGLASDDTIFEGEGRWYDCSLVRWWRGKPQTMGGWQKINTDAKISGICRGLLSWTNTAGTLNVGLGTHTNLYVLVGGGLYDITPPGLAAGNLDGSAGSGFGSGAWGSGVWGGGSAAEYWPRTWSMDAFGQILIANPRNGTIYQWTNDVTVAAAPVANAPANVTCISVAETRQVLAFGCTNVSGVFNPMAIRGSDANNPTAWTPSVGSLAFEVTLSGGGRIVAARRVGKYYLVWTDNAVYLGTYVGSSSQIWRFDKVGEHCGLIGAQAVCIRNQTAFWVGTDTQIRALTLGGAVQILPSSVQNSMADNLAANQQDKIVGSTLSPFDEVFFFYPDARDDLSLSVQSFLGTTQAGDLLVASSTDSSAWISLFDGNEAGLENSRYIGFSASDPSAPWFRGILSRTSFVDQGPSPYPIGVDTTGYAYYHEIGQTADGAVLPWFIESAGQYLGAGDRRLLISGIWPDIANQSGTISLTLYLRGYPQDTENTKGPFLLAPGASKKDFLADGRIIRLRFSGSSAPAFARLGKPVFATQPTGLQ